MFISGARSGDKSGLSYNNAKQVSSQVDFTAAKDVLIRKIILFKSKRLQFMSFFINWLLFATFVEIVIFPYAGDGYTVFTDNAFSLVMAGAFVAVILFGLKEIAKIALLIFCSANMIGVSGSL